MSIFCIADSHFSHRNILIHCRRFPWCKINPDFDPDQPKDFRLNWPIMLTEDGIEAHDEALAEAWNGRVSRGDTVVICGDFAFNRHAHFIQRLKGTKIMILGNHDKMNQECLRLFSEVHEMGCRKVWDVGLKGQSGRPKKQNIVFCHYAMQTWASSYHGSWMLYGHSHGRLPEWDNRLTFDTGVDVWGYAPVPMEAIVKKMLMKIEIANGKMSDGESAPVGKWNRNPEQRMLDTRAKNLAILKSMGIESKLVDDTLVPDLEHMSSPTPEEQEE